MTIDSSNSNYDNDAFQKIYCRDKIGATCFSLFTKDETESETGGSYLKGRRNIFEARKIFHCYRRMNQRINNSITSNHGANVKYPAKLKYRARRLNLSRNFVFPSYRDKYTKNKNKTRLSYIHTHTHILYIYICKTIRQDKRIAHDNNNGK